MAYNTKSIVKDVDNKPIPQYYNQLLDAYEVLKGRNGANRVELYDADGNAVNLATLFASIVTALGQVEIADSALPTGAATAAKQDTLKTAIDAVATLITAIKDTNGVKKITDALPAGTNTLGGVKVIGNDTLLQGNVTLNGSAQQLPNTASKVITMQASPDNAGYVYVGKSDASATKHMAILTPGSSMTFYVSNLNLLYVIGTANDKICYGGEV